MATGPVYRNANEPQVTVKGIPQSQYNANPPVAPTGGGIGGWIKMHPIMAVAGGLGIVVVLILLYQWWQNNSSSNSANAGIDPNTGIPYSQEASGVTYGGAQSEADMQQMMSFQNEEIGLLQQLTNQQNNSSSSSSSSSGATTYTVTAADVAGGIGPKNNPLQDIAQKEGFANWQQLYNFGTNMQTIQSTAKQHGVADKPGYGGWHRYIYQGEVLQI